MASAVSSRRIAQDGLTVEGGHPNEFVNEPEQLVHQYGLLNKAENDDKQKDGLHFYFSDQRFLLSVEAAEID